jgi:hypothetical protein
MLAGAPTENVRTTAASRTGARQRRCSGDEPVAFTAVTEPLKPPLHGVVTGDPFADLPVGFSIPMEPIVMGSSDAHRVASGVTNWDFFEGALLSVVTRQHGSSPLEAAGTAVIVAPGLALTATHVIDQALADLPNGVAAVSCLGIRSTGPDIWNVRSVSYSDGDDFAYLSLQLASRLTPGWRFTSFAVTTRAPRDGEVLTILGFRFDHREDGEFAGDLYAAAGRVVSVYHPMRDSFLMPYPTIEISCGSLGAMSGGAVVNGDGILVGVVGRGLVTNDGSR